MPNLRQVSGPGSAQKVRVLNSTVSFRVYARTRVRFRRRSFYIWSLTMSDGSEVNSDGLKLTFESTIVVILILSTHSLDSNHLRRILSN